MSEMYSSASGSYQNYLSQRSTDQITKTIKEENFKQNMMNFVYAGAITQSVSEVGNKIDRVNANIQRMSTGIQTSINQNTFAVVASSAFLANTFNEGFNKLNNTLDLGFAGVQSSIGAMSAAMSAGFDRFQQSIDKWGTKICEKLDAIHDIVNNPLLTASRELSRRAQTNAQKQFYEEALEDIKGAVEKNKTDYISWGLMGKIYLFGMSEFSNVVDVPKALEAFTNACKYITPDIDESDEAKNMAAEFYFYKAFAEYVLFNESKIAGNADTALLESSIRDNTKSFTLSDKMYESVYNKAKALALLGKNEEAFEEIKKAIKIDGLYSIKILNDPDLQSLTSQIESFLNEEKLTILNEIKEILPFFDNYVFCEDSEFAQASQQELNRIKEITQDIPYLDIRYGFEFLSNLKVLIEKNSHLLIDREVSTVDLRKEFPGSGYKLIRYALNGEIGICELFLGHLSLRYGLKYSYDTLFSGQMVKRKGEIGGPLYCLLAPYGVCFEDLQMENYSKGHFQDIDKKIWETMRNDFNTYCISKGVACDQKNFDNWFIIDINTELNEKINIDLDEKTILKVDKKLKGTICQPGIVSKKDFEVGQQEKQREKEKHIEKLRLYHEQQKKRQEAEESDTVDLVIKNGHFWANINTNLIGLNAYIKNDISCKEVDIECIAKTKYQHKAVEHFANQPPIIKANIGASITLKKNQFFWKEGEVCAYGKRHNITNKEEFFTLLNEHKLYAELSVSDGLSLGILIEDKELKQKRKAEKTKKHIIITSVIVAIIAVIGIIVF